MAKKSVNELQTKEIYNLRDDFKKFEISINQQLKEVKDILKPITETYTTIARLGKWGTAILVFISIVVGIILGVKELFRH